jgi:hypothetical protein
MRSKTYVFPCLYSAVRLLARVAREGITIVEVDELLFVSTGPDACTMIKSHMDVLMIKVDNKNTLSNPVRQMDSRQCST